MSGGGGGGVVRELIALFSARMDNASFSQVESRIFRLRTAVGGAAAAFATHTALEWGEMAARFEGTRSVFVQAGGDLANLRKQTRGLVSDMSLVKDYNFAQQFGFGDRLPEFFKIANAAAKKFGIDKEEALKKLIFGIALRSTPLLKNVGINVKGDAKNILEAYASLHGLQAKTLSHAQQAQAYADEAVRQGAAMVREVGEAGLQATDSYGRMHASIENLRVAFGRLVDSAVQQVAPAFEVVAHWIERISQSRALNRVMEQFATAMTLVLRVAGPFASVAVDIARTLALIPGSGYILAALLLGPLYTGFVSTLLVIGRVVPGLAAVASFMRDLIVLFPALTANLHAAALGAWELAGSVWATWAPLIGFGIAAGIAALALEELFAIFDDKKLGLIEQYGGAWEKLVDRLSTVSPTSDWAIFFQWFRLQLTETINTLGATLGLISKLNRPGWKILTDEGGETSAAFDTFRNDIQKMNAAMFRVEQFQGAGGVYAPEYQHRLRPGEYGPGWQMPAPGGTHTKNTNATINIHGVSDPVKAGKVAADRLHEVSNRDAHEALTPPVPTSFEPING